MMKALLGLALASAPLAANAPAVPTTTDRSMPSPFRASFETVPMVECANSRGSGVRISDDIVITATHVINDSAPCGVEGRPAAIAFNQPDVDFTALRVGLGQGFRAIVSCDGIKAGQSYLALGYAFGGAANVEPLVGTNRTFNDGSVQMRGRVYRGMSGGGVFTGEGQLVAITVRLNTEADWAYVVPLTSTYLCA